MSVVAPVVYVDIDFERKAGDTDAFVDQLLDDDPPGSGNFGPLNLTGATVTFTLYSLTATGHIGASLVTGTAVIVDAPQGVVSYTPTGPQVTALTGAPTQYAAHWVVTIGLDVRRIPRGNAYRRVMVGKA